MVCFRALFELSISKMSREREFRADRIAARVTSPRDVAAALLRIAAYSSVWRSIEEELFGQQTLLESADVSGKLDTEFAAYAERNGIIAESGELCITHPFDSHPPMEERLSAIGVQLAAEERQSLLSSVSDGGWYRRIENAGELERQLWDDYEAKFIESHRKTLPYRLRPDNAEEQAIVESAFPTRVFETAVGRMSLDFEKLSFVRWSDPIYLREVVRWRIREEGYLEFVFHRGFEREREFEINRLSKQDQRAFIEAFQTYLGRCKAAAEFQEQLKTEKVKSNAPSEA
jgi:hypothetical protein